MIDHKDIIPLVPIEMSGLSKDTDLGTSDKESGYTIIKNFVNEKTKHIITPIESLKQDGCISLGKIVNSNTMKEEIFRFPIYRGHIKNDLYSDGIAIHDYNDKTIPFGMYCWSMTDLLKCKTVTDIASSPLIIDFVSRYLGCLPTCYGINCMLSNGTSGHGTTRRHRDSDDFKFLSLFIYLDDVMISNGPHVYEIGTHLGNSNGVKGNELPTENIERKIFTGKAGEAFIEDNWGVHYGMPLRPDKKRICLWVRYGLYDNYTARNSVKILDHKTEGHMFNMNNEMNKYIFRFLV